ncbi:unnamed protein product [Schistocephalus solidus]|uniref:RxLR effector protein n=1 Tax=Schistocephalus solidus TaxID=70667 RepID=A0A183SLU4_SCHSO|nr:unnamed protein product [Schistocephalus solidus]
MGFAQQLCTTLGFRRPLENLKMISIHHFGLLVLLAGVAVATEDARGQASDTAAHQRDVMAQRPMHDPEEGDDLYSRLVAERNVMDDDVTEQDLAEILKRSPHFWKRYHAFWKRSPAFWKRSAFWKRASFW